MTSTSESSSSAARADWRSGVIGVLRKSGRVGPDDSPERPEDLIGTTTLDGLTLSPLYTADDLPSVLPAPQDRAAGWHVCPRISDDAVHELETGATALWVDPAGQPLADVLAEVKADLAPVVVDPGADALAGAREALAWAAEQSGAQVQLGVDPLGELARRGSAARAGTQVSAADLAALLNDATAQGDGIAVLVADGSAAIEAGGTEAQQLALTVASAIQYLRDLAAEGIDPAATAARLDLRVAVTADQFAALCSVRALRQLWGQVAATLAIPDTVVPRIHAVTAEVMMTVQDPWVNMLRVTVAAFGAGAGGADLVTVAPFDARLGRADNFSRRIARNTQSLLLMESHIGAVTDPGAGSFYVERRTADLAEKAWGLVREIEAAGGARAALQSGLIAGWVSDSWAKRKVALAKRRQPLTGVSEFPILDQAPVEREPFAADDASYGDNALVPVHYAQDFEALRATAAAASTPPAVPLVLLGTIATSSARAGFATNALGVGGVSAVQVGPIADAAGLDEALAAANVVAGPVAVVGGRDKEYEAFGDDVVKALKDKGFDWVLVAGKAGVIPSADASVAMGADVVALLTEIHERLARGASK